MTEPDDSKWSVINSYSHPNPFATLPADCQETFREFLTMNHKRWLMADSHPDEPAETGERP